MQEQWSRLRHDLRSGFNNLRLCVAAFETETDTNEKLLWMTYIEKAADKCLNTIDQIEQLADSGASPDNSR